MTSRSITKQFPLDADRLERLHARLERAAHANNLLDIAYRTVDSTVGTLLLAATTRGLLRVAFANEGHDRVLQHLSNSVSPRMLESPIRLDPIVRQLDEYFTNQRDSFNIALDWSLSTGFRRTVLKRLATKIAYGSTVNYAALARLSGSPKAVRAVGTACATNPVPIVVPCHRVIRSDGTFGAYRGGPAAKRTLLGLEQYR